MQTPTPKTSRRDELVGPLVAGPSQKYNSHDRQKPVRTERGHADPLLTSFDDASADAVPGWGMTGSRCAGLVGAAATRCGGRRAGSPGSASHAIGEEADRHAVPPEPGSS